MLFVQAMPRKLLRRLSDEDLPTGRKPE